MGHWNAAARLATFGVVAHLVGRNRAHLAAAHQEVHTLQRFLPICGQCKKIRDDQGYWQQVERYLAQRAPVTHSHGLCDECAATFRADLAELRRVGADGGAVE